MRRLRILSLGLLGLLGLADVTRAQDLAVGSAALSGWRTGTPLDRRPTIPVSAYSSSPYYSGRYGSLAPPIFMTTLNTPGIYGAYSYGTGGITLTREPFFSAVYDDRETIPSTSITTAPLRRPTTPAGAPTMAAGPPSVTPAVPGSAVIETYPGQIPAVNVPATAPEGTTLRTMPAAPGATTSLSTENAARVVVRVPEDARLDFGGMTMPQTGRVRKFFTPPLVPGQRYHYDVQATWQEDGRTVVRERKVNVYAGEKADIDFLGPEENHERELHTRPILPAPVPAAAPGALPRTPPRPAAAAPPGSLPEPPTAIPPGYSGLSPAVPRVQPPAVPPEGTLETPPGMTPDAAPGTKPGKPPVVPPLRPTLPPVRGD